MILALISGIVLGYIITLTGVGGGVLVIPTLSLLFQLNPSVAIGTASLYTTLTKLFALIRHIRLGNIDYKSCLRFLIPSSAGVLVSSVTINYFLSLYRGTETEASIQNFLYIIILVVIAFSIIVMIREIFFKKKGYIKKEKNIYIFIVSTLLTGIIMGTTGVGGGVLIIPVLVIFYKLKTKKIIGGSIFIALVLSLIASLVYTKGGNIDFDIALFMTIGSILGIWVGGKTLRVISDKALNILVFLAISLCSVLLLLLFVFK